MADEYSSSGNLIFFPVLLGVIRARPLPPGVAGPAEADRYVLINHFSRGMEFLQGDGDGGADRANDLLMEMVMSASFAGGRKGPPPASKASVEALRTVESLDEGECSICLEKFVKSVVAKEMPCGHTYHGECIVTWLGMHGSCPICRYTMPEEEASRKNDAADGGGGRENRISVAISFSRSVGDESVAGNHRSPQSWRPQQ